MIKETRLIVRLIALWVIFIGGLGFFLWSTGKFTVALVNVATKGYAVNYGYYGGQDSSLCLQLPTYPDASSEDYYSTAKKAEVAKYKADYEAYSQERQVRCEADLLKQEEVQKKQDKAQENQNRALAVGEFMAYLVLSVLSAFAVREAYKEIKRSELA